MNLANLYKLTDVSPFSAPLSKNAAIAKVKEFNQKLSTARANGRSAEYLEANNEDIEQALPVLANALGQSTEDVRKSIFAINSMPHLEMFPVF